jgi:hypothetical protein
MPFFPLAGLMASFRSAAAAGQLTLSRPDAHSRKVRYAPEAWKTRMSPANR